MFASQSDGVSVVIEVLTFEEDLPGAGANAGADTSADAGADAGADDDAGAGADGQSAKHFFEDLATANGASSSVCDFCGNLTDRCPQSLGRFGA